MFTYPYVCEQCGFDTDVIKDLSDIDRQETCPICNTKMLRVIRKVTFYGASDWNTEHYSVPLGKMVKSNKEERRLARERGLIEIGNEPMDKMIKADQERNEKIREDNWKKV